MSSLKKRRKDINIINKPKQWRSFSVDDIKINKQNKMDNPIIDGYTQIKNTHRFNETLLRAAYKKPGDWIVVSGDKWRLLVVKLSVISMMMLPKSQSGVI